MAEATIDDELRAILTRARTIAVLGAKGGEQDDAYRVPRYLQQHGYRVLSVSPKLERVLGERAYPSLAALPEPVDLVDVFRAPQHLLQHADEILALKPLPAVVWFQLGIRNDAAAARLEAAGVRVVQDRCIMVDHRRLLG